LKEVLSLSANYSMTGWSMLLAILLSTVVALIVAVETKDINGTNRRF
jgi:hypothetical protein